MTCKQLIAQSLGAFQIFLAFTNGISAQSGDDNWLRVTTGEQSIVEVDRTSLLLESDRIISARFRTSLINPEPIPGRPATAFKSRIDTIRFRTHEGTYQIISREFLNDAGKVVFSSLHGSDGNWSASWGRTDSKMLSAAKQLRPFGNWKILSYRYASGELPSADDPAEVKRLVGSNVRLSIDGVSVGGETCAKPEFDQRVVTNREFYDRVGSSFDSLGLKLDRLDAIRLACDAENKTRIRSILIRLADQKALMLWDGVFLEIERPGNTFLP